MASRAGKIVHKPGGLKLEDLKRALFKSPDSEEEPDGTDVSKELMNKLQIEHDVESSLRGVMKDLHDSRIKQLRELQKDISSDDWRYTPIEKLIGLH